MKEQSTERLIESRPSREDVEAFARQKTPLTVEQTFRRLDAPELLVDVANGVAYVNGMRQRATEVAV